MRLGETVVSFKVQGQNLGVDEGLETRSGLAKSIAKSSSISDRASFLKGVPLLT